MDEFVQDYETFDLGDVVLQGGATLRDAKLAYKTYGELNADRWSARPLRSSRCRSAEDRWSNLEDRQYPRRRRRKFAGVRREGCGRGDADETASVP